MGPVLIAGAGAVGCWLAGRLAAAGKEVHLFARPGRALDLVERGLTLETLPEADPERVGGTERFEAARLGVHDAAVDAPRRPALLIIATRAYQTPSVAQVLAAGGVEPTAVLTLQNGLGNAETLADRFGADRVLAGTTTHGVTWSPPALVRHTGLGVTKVGAWQPPATGAAKEAAALLSQARIPTEPVDDPRHLLWWKVAINAAINPPTALHEILNGALLDGDGREEELRAAAREVAYVAQAEGIMLDPGEAEEAAVLVARRTARNRSSMLQARLAGRPLETEAITGEVVRRGRRHGVAVPVNERHLAALRRLVLEE